MSLLLWSQGRTHSPFFTASLHGLNDLQGHSFFDADQRRFGSTFTLLHSCAGHRRYSRKALHRRLDGRGLFKGNYSSLLSIDIS